MRRFSKKNDAVNTMISWFLILVLLSSVTAAILLGSKTAIDNSKNKTVTTVIGKAFEEFDKNIKDLLPSCPTQGDAEFAIDKGSLQVDSKGSRIVVMYSYSDAFDFFVENAESIDFDVDNADAVEAKLKVKITKFPAIDTAEKYTDHKDTSIISDGSGALMQLRHVEYPLDTASGDDPACEEVAFASIWIFDLGRMIYNNPGGNIEKIIYENCAIIKDDLENAYVDYSSNIENEGNNVIQLSVGLIRRGGNIAEVTNAGVYTVDFEVKNNSLRNKINTEVYNFKIMIKGDYATEWYDYLTASNLRTFDFTERTTPNGEKFLWFNNGEKTDLVFSTYVTQINDISIS